MTRTRLTTAAVVADAAALADAEGLGAVSVSAVARRLSVKPASLYEHVAGLAPLLDGVQLLALRELGERVAEAVAGRASAEALRALADAHREYAAERPGLWAALQRPASGEVAGSPEAARVAGALIAVVRGYPVPAAAVVHAARLVGATVNGFLSLTRADAFAHRPESEDASWTAAVDALDRALASWPAESDAP
jgi:AcrR family transcriptional regulator